MQMHRLISDFLDNDWLISDRQLKFMLFITRNTHFTLGAAHDAWLQIINIELGNWSPSYPLGLSRTDQIALLIASYT